MYTDSYGMEKHYTTFKSLKGEKTDLYLGMELEVFVKELAAPKAAGLAIPGYYNIYADRHKEAAARVMKLMDGHAILKPEHGDGFEIVTLPATLNYHRNVLWGKFFDEAPDFLGGITSHATYGIHVHFSRKAIDDKSLARLLYFYHAPENSKFLTEIAGRLVGPKGCYNIATKKTLIEGNAGITLNEGMLKRGACGIRTNEAYKPTVEVRIFQSDPTKQHVMKCLEFTHSVVEWSKQAAHRESECSSGYYIQWFMSNEKHKYYPYLANCLIEKKFITGDVMEVAANTAITPEELAQATKLQKVVEVIRKRVTKKKAVA